MNKKITRRDFLKGMGALVVVTTLAATLPPQPKRTHITFTRAPEYTKAQSRAWQMHLAAVKAQGRESFASFEAGAGRMTDPLWETPMRHPARVSLFTNDELPGIGTFTDKPFAGRLG